MDFLQYLLEVVHGNNLQLESGVEVDLSKAWIVWASNYGRRCLKRYYLDCDTHNRKPELIVAQEILKCIMSRNGQGLVKAYAPLKQLLAELQQEKVDIYPPNRLDHKYSTRFQAGFEYAPCRPWPEDTILRLLKEELAGLTNGFRGGREKGFQGGITVQDDHLATILDLSTWQKGADLRLMLGSFKKPVERLLSSVWHIRANVKGWKFCARDYKLALVDEGGQVVGKPQAMIGGRVLFSFFVLSERVGDGRGRPGMSVAGLYQKRDMNSTAPSHTLVNFLLTYLCACVFVRVGRGVHVSGRRVWELLSTAPTLTTEVTKSTGFACAARVC